MYCIRRRLREIREELRAASGIQELLIYFTENNPAKWTHDGGPRHDLSEPTETDSLQSDIAKMLDHFACVSNVTKARIRLPPSLERNEQIDTLRWHAIGVIETMQGEGTLADEQSSTLGDYKISDMDGKHFKRVTAQKARVKPDALTLDGLDKMSKFEWHAFTEVWPHFETLTEGEEGGVFKGEWHYMVETTSPDRARGCTLTRGCADYKI